ncbi:hypothetical protein [Cognatazoarcus halotolerans]|uniref:hypothetical protein n=1 Tax=Cognatazoarcus halotolerans TaxID=2686016 RepID=UPI001357A0CB|nr:hypothetical protein [Cognatazoarcus halotolerans]MBX3679051.1 hypothetical protein [Rhodocyclaceae bacterium]MCB1901446.1 hypothetical protein [Rhodocyclaceae bacterium]MCP5308172.1 hypothetical protein [Zoogloeaceae bacterium]
MFSLPRTLLVCMLFGLAHCAQADTVVVTGKTSLVMTLDRQDVERLYLGRTAVLPDGTPVTLADLPPGNVRDGFYLALTGKNPVQIRTYWSRIVFTGRALPPKEAESPAQLRRWLASNPNLIGYLSDTDVDESVRVLLRIR